MEIVLEGVGYNEFVWEVNWDKNVSLILCYIYTFYLIVQNVVTVKSGLEILSLNPDPSIANSSVPYT